jgi:hypothetical protein
MTPAEAAVVIANAIECNKRLVLRPKTIHLLRVMNAMFPRVVERRMFR